MWPWEHLAFGYVLYTAFVHLVWRDSPQGGPTLLLALGTQVPDLVDKPLGWGLGTYATGYGAAHSVLIAGPVLVAVLAVAVHRGRTRLGAGYVAGHASHMLGDAINPLRHFDPPMFERLLWPLSDFEAYSNDYGILERGMHYFGEFVGLMARPENVGVVLVYASVFVFVAAIWAFDGLPGVGTLYRLVTRAGGRGR